MHSKNLLMACGPVQMDPKILKLGAEQVPYMRTSEFSAWASEINQGLQYLFQTQRPVFTVACSGTGVMQMAVDNICGPDDTALTFNTGVFGKRWGDIVRRTGIHVITEDMEPRHNVTPDILEAALKCYPDVSIVFLTYNETSTTALADVKGCAEIISRTNRLLVVDAVSALLVEPMQMDAWGVDVAITSSQKALALPPGLGFIAFSDKAWKRISNIPCRSLYFDAKAYECNCLRNFITVRRGRFR
ncbi:MAG: alanine--glyoxylate aminotransferase family protein [Desulfovibrio sp.]|nr:alanine--glyoxylate aminotransferase family protein [Desulfovibrio sp.]